MGATYVGMFALESVKGIANLWIPCKPSVDWLRRRIYAQE